MPHSQENKLASATQVVETREFEESDLVSDGINMTLKISCGIAASLIIIIFIINIFLIGIACVRYGMRRKMERKYQKRNCEQTVIDMHCKVEQALMEAQSKEIANLKKEMAALANVIKSKEEKTKLMQNQVSSPRKAYNDERLKNKKCLYKTTNDIMGIKVRDQGYVDMKAICLPVTAIDNTRMVRLDSAERLRLETVLLIRERKQHKKKQRARTRRQKLRYK